MNSKRVFGQTRILPVTNMKTDIGDIGESLSMNCALLLTKTTTNKTMRLSDNWTNMNTKSALFYFLQIYKAVRQTGIVFKCSIGT